VATGLVSLGIEPGDRVAVMLPNWPEFHFATHGVWKVGAVEVPINTMFGREETAHILKDAGVRMVFTSPELAKIIEDLRVDVPDLETLIVVGSERVHGALTFDDLLARGSADFESVGSDDSLAIIAYTSGTTGFPKGAMLTHHQIVVSMEAVKRRLELDQTDPVLQVLPCFHSNASMIGIVFAWFLGGNAILLERFETEAFVETVRSTRPALFAFVPTLLHDLSRAAGDLNADFSSVKYVVYGAAPCPPRIRREVEERFQLKLLQAYGMTEGPNAITLDPPDGPVKSETVGQPLPHIAVQIVNEEGDAVATGEVGEVCLGPVGGGFAGLSYEPMKGYWGNPEGTAAALQDGFFHTGDIGALDADGYLRIVDRKKDMIIRGGNNIFPAELERVLLDHPLVEEAYVVGVPHERLGEVPKAYVVTGAGQEVSTEELLELVRSQLAAYKRLEQVEVVTTDALPRNALGKVLKRELRARESATESA
jgi:long-chain acyl-CoA synthetase